jgi:hypothetical protein
MRPLPSLFGFNCDLQLEYLVLFITPTLMHACFSTMIFALLMILTFECNEFSVLEQ